MLARAADRARRTGQGTAERLELVEGDLIEARVPKAGPFGPAILALNSILLLAERGRQRRAIQRLFALLAPGGIALVAPRLPPADALRPFAAPLSLQSLRRAPPT